MRLPSGAVVAKDGAHLIHWAEKGTGGEAFIPLGQQHRQRSTSLWFDVGRRLGVLESAGSSGGSPQVVQSGRNGPLVEVGTINAVDADAAARRLSRRIMQAIAAAGVTDLPNVL
jgi:hypothetical protein